MNIVGCCVTHMVCGTEHVECLYSPVFTAADSMKQCTSGVWQPKFPTN
jgi:hypothetical protein